MGRAALVFASAGAALAAAVLWSFSVGRFPVAAADVVRALWSALGGPDSGLAPNVEALVLQVRTAERGEVMATLRAAGLGAISHVVARVQAGSQARDTIEVWRDAKVIFAMPGAELQKVWSEVSWRIARLRDNPESADAEFARAADADDRGPSMALTFDPAEDVAAPMIASGRRPRMAIFREQGVNSHYEMASRWLCLPSASVMELQSAMRSETQSWQQEKPCWQSIILTASIREPASM